MNRDFLEIDGRARVVLKANVAGLGPWSAIGIDGPSVLRRDGLSFAKIGDLDTIQNYDDVRSIQGDLHDVPFVERLYWTRQGFGECVEHAGAGIIVRPVADLDFIAAVDRHPGFRGLFGNPDKDPGI